MSGTLTLNQIADRIDDGVNALERLAAAAERMSKMLGLLIDGERALPVSQYVPLRSAPLRKRQL